MTTPTAAEVERATVLINETLVSVDGAGVRSKWTSEMFTLRQKLAAEFAADREARDRRQKTNLALVDRLKDMENERDAARARAGALAEALRKVMDPERFICPECGRSEIHKDGCSIFAALAQTDAEALAALRASVLSEAEKVVRDLSGERDKPSDRLIGYEEAGDALAALRERGKA